MTVIDLTHTIREDLPVYPGTEPPLSLIHISIESAIIKQNKLNHKAMSVAEFRSACHQFADHYIDVQRECFKLSLIHISTPETWWPWAYPAARTAW